MRELKPCPFCGGKARLDRVGTHYRSCVVCCDICGCTVESGGEGLECGTLWNTRALATPPDALEVVRKQENYTDDFSKMVSECRSHLNGVTTPRTSKSEKEHFGWIALEKLRIIENLWHGIKDSESEAAALIQPTVPMEMLEAVWDAGNEWNGSEDPLRARREDIADIAAKYGVKVGG